MVWLARQRGTRRRPLVLEQLGERCLLSYTITDLGTLPGGTFSEAKGINAADPLQVVGLADTGDGTTHAFLWDAAHGMQDLGTLGGPNSAAAAINDAGQVVGNADTADGQTHAFLDNGGVMTDLGTLANGTTSAATAISAAGQVIGFSTLIPGVALKYHAFLYSDGVLTDLRTLAAGSGSNSVAWALDNESPVRIVGQAQGPIYPPPCEQYANYHAAAWQAPNRTDLGTLPGGHESHAFGINAAGEVVGDSADDESPPCNNSPAHAFLRKPDGTMVRLDDGVAGVRQSRAYAINDGGQVVGTWSDTTGQQDIPKYAFFWDHNVFTDLISLVPDSGWTQLINANAINDAGQIVGWGVRSDTGATHAFLMTPTAAPGGAELLDAIHPAVPVLMPMFTSPGTHPATHGATTAVVVDRACVPQPPALAVGLPRHEVGEQACAYAVGQFTMRFPFTDLGDDGLEA